VQEQKTGSPRGTFPSASRNGTYILKANKKASRVSLFRSGNFDSSDIAELQRRNCEISGLIDVAMHGYEILARLCEKPVSWILQFLSAL